MKPVALFLVFFLAGCAIGPRIAPPRAGEVKSVHAARDGLDAGKTKAEVRAALGKGTEIDFDSGYAVWVYRQQLLENQAGPRRELVLLFTPAGVLERSRVR